MCLQFHTRATSNFQLQFETHGSRKGTSINHLINWNAARPLPISRTFHAPRPSRPRYPTHGIGSGHHVEDKARYINANYRFIVHPLGDYRPQTIDPDVVVPWDRILQIVASSESQAASCPICLCDTVAPRMAKCGHIFCMPCLLRYMAQSEDSNTHMPEKRQRWKKCPICWDSVYYKDVKPVRWFVGQENKAPREGDDVVLRLVMRQAGSTLSLPRDGADLPAGEQQVPWYYAAEVMDYARVMKGNRKYMEEQYVEEIKKLKEMEHTDELMFGEEGEWTRKAISTIKNLIEGLKEMDDGGEPEPTEEASKPTKRPPIQFNTSTEDVPDMYKYSQSNNPSIEAITPVDQPPVSSSEDTSDKQVSLLADSLKERMQISRTADSPYYFYQALPHYYLAPLDIRILKAAFGNFSSFPATILPRVENISSGHTVDYELRKRTRYLSHLPSGCEVSFLECDWTDTVPEEVLKVFEKEIDARRSKKKAKDTREERERRRAEQAEYDERWAHLKGTRPQPTASTSLAEAEFAPLPGQSPEGTSPPWPNRSTQGFSALSSASNSRTTVWGTPVIEGLEGSSPPDRLPKDDGWLSMEQQLMEEDLMAHDELDSHIRVTGGRAPSQGKSKKKKKVTLMTNGGRRGA